MFQYSPYALLMLAAAMVSFLTGILVWRRRPSTGITALVVMLNFIAFWSLVYGIEILVTDPDLKLALVYVGYLSIVSIPTIWVIFVLRYTGRDQWLTPRTFGLLIIIPTVTYLVIISNPAHGTFHTDIEVTTVDGIITLVPKYGPTFWVHTAYSYALLLSGAALLFQTLRQSPQLYRGQIVWMLIATFSPWIANSTYIFDINPLPAYVDATPLAFTITGAACAWSMYRYRLMDVVPVANDLVVDNLISVVIVLDLNNRIVQANAKALEILGVSANDVIGQPATIALSNYPDYVKQSSNAKQIKDEITIVSGKDTCTFDLNILPLRNRNGALSGRVIMMHDISERKEMERLKDRFVSNVSHELRTPLASIMLALGMLNRTPEHYATYIPRLYRDVGRLNGLIEDLLRLSRLDQDRASLVLEPVDVTLLAAELVQDRRPLAEDKGLTLDFAAPSPLPPVMADAGLLGQALSVILTNAINYTPPGGTVTIHTTHTQDDTGDWVQLQVMDTGPGIASEELPLLFDRFYRGQAGTQSQAPGTGLGLSIAREIMARHQGRITAANRADGPGAVFTLWVPVATAMETVAFN